MEVDVTMEETNTKPIPMVEINDDSLSELEDGELEDDSDDEPLKDRRITYSNVPDSKDMLSKRAERFGVINTRRLPENPEVRKVHISMGVNSQTRTEALHLYGTESMQTQDIFTYFDDPPASVEWLTSQSCNAVWLDEESCAKALLKQTVKIRGQPECIDSDSEEEDSVDASELRCTLPPGVWRKGKTRSFAPNLLIRYATVSDKKEMRPFVPESLKMKEKLFPDGGDESAKKVVEQENESNPWSGLARQWGKFERHSQNKFGGVQDARQLIKEKALRGNLIMKDARDLIKYNRICRLEKGLDPETLAEYKKDRHRELKRSYEEDNSMPGLRKRRRPSPRREENLQIIVENDSYQPKRPSSSSMRSRARSVSSSSDSSSSSSGDSSSSSSDDSSSSSSSSEDDDDEEEAPPPPKPTLKTPWNKSSNKFKPESSLLIEIDNDHYRKKRSGQ